MLDVFVIQACLCVMCSGLRSDVGQARCSICVKLYVYDYLMLCSVDSRLRSDAVVKALVIPDFGPMQWARPMLFWTTVQCSGQGPS